MQQTTDIEDIAKDKAQRVLARTYATPTCDDVARFEPLVRELIATSAPVDRLKARFRFSGKNSFLLQIFHALQSRSGHTMYSPENEQHLRERLKIKKGKSNSGVLVITVFTSPYPEYTDEDGNTHVVQPFTCKQNCAYCPNQPGQPRSYLELEPGVQRANRNHFDPRAQMWDRMQSLDLIGHPVDKLEILVLGGTWSHYPRPYQEQFVRDLYYSANTFHDPQPRRPPLPLEDEQRINRTAKCKVIGLTLETRPDAITTDEIIRFRKYGATRVQLGVQHTDDSILKAIQRGCTTQDAIRAIALLKDAAFKIDIHLMPNLPTSTPQKDKHMFLDQLLGLSHPVPVRHTVTTTKRPTLYESYALTHPELQADQWKIYPTMITPYTHIKTLYEQGIYKPYSNTDLDDVLLETLAHMFPWIRINRLVRDISGDYVILGPEGNARQNLEAQLLAEGKHCQCIRCREVKDAPFDPNYTLVTRHYNASGGDEYFISAESPDTRTLYGFLRLRIPVTNFFPELSGCALLRELHVYGQLQTTSSTPSPHLTTTATQHKGIGHTLIQHAIHIARNRHHLSAMAVIPGEGVRAYYQDKHGFQDTPGLGRFMKLVFQNS